MVVAVSQVTFALHGVGSLKQKRGIVKRIIERTRNRFSISIAEVEAQDSLGKAVVGMSCVGNDSKVVNSVMDRALDFMEELYLAPIADATLEILHV